MQRPVRSLSSFGLVPARSAEPLVEHFTTVPIVDVSDDEDDRRLGWLRSIRADARRSCGVSTNFLARKTLGEYMEDDVAGVGFDIRENELEDDAFRLVKGWDAETETPRPLVSLEQGPDGAPVVITSPLPEQEDFLGPRDRDRRGERLQEWRDHWDDGLDVTMQPSRYCFSAESPVTDDVPTVADKERSAGGWSDVEPDHDVIGAIPSLGSMSGCDGHRAFSEWTNYLARLARSRQERFCQLAEWLHRASAKAIRAHWHTVRTAHGESIRRCVDAITREEGLRKTKVAPQSSTAWLGLDLTTAQMKALEAYRRTVLMLRDEGRNLPPLRWVDKPRASLILPANIRRTGCARATSLPSSGPRTFTPPKVKRQVSRTRVATLCRHPSVFSYAEPPTGAGNSVCVLARREAHLCHVELDRAERWLPLQPANVDHAAHVRDYYRRITHTCPTPLQALALTKREEPEYIDLDRPSDGE